MKLTLRLKSWFRALFQGVGPMGQRIMVLMGLLASLALGLGVVGIYGVLSSVLAERTPEIGIRMALGAPRRDILLSVVGRGMRLATVGAVVGLTGALALSRWLRGLLFEISPADSLACALVSVMVLAIALGAFWLPARRAARADPMVTLRAA